MTTDWVLVFGLAVVAGLVLVAGAMAVLGLRRQRGPKGPSIFAEDTPGTVFLFDGERLVDATPAARAFLGSRTPVGRAWFRTLSQLEPLFPGLTQRLEDLHREGSFVQCSAEDIEPPLLLQAELLGGITRLTLVDPEGWTGRSGADAISDLALREEVTGLRETLGHAPILVWQVNAAGQVSWANEAYLKAAIERLEPGQELCWPLPHLFATSEGQGVSGRHSLKLGETLAWFEVTSVPVTGHSLNYALPADRLVQAEVSLRDFMQTLTRTFADLPIGLAIFDRARVLQMFNPALIDLTDLPPDFLIRRPTLSMLLDAMRERSMLPEPKDYRSWRKQMVELEAAAEAGLYQDTWTLPSGKTYRVTGRPHPNGALAFLFEDISTEISRTRRYHADLEQVRAVVEVVDQPVVVFNQDGSVALANEAAGRLWGKPEAGLGLALGEPDIVTAWRNLTAPTLLWNDLVDYIGSFGPREPWTGDVRLKDGRLVDCAMSPLPHGGTLVTFRVGPAPGDGKTLAAAGEATLVA